MKQTITAFASVFVVLSLCAIAFSEEENWSRFRGPTGQGTSTATELPTEWSAEENIKWKTEIPGNGWSSPIVWGERIFLTSTTDEGKQCHVLAFDRSSGEMLWDKVVFSQEPQFKNEKNSYSTSTPTTDGKLVYAVFCSGGFAALDFDGNVKWTNEDLHFYSQHGLGSSPILYKDKLILSVSPSNREEPKKLGWQEPWDKSYILALDKNTGKELWKGKRGMSRISHATPIVVSVDGKDQIISPAGDVIQGFDPENGNLIWTVRTYGEPCVPSPVLAENLVFSAAMPGDGIHAVRIDGKGDCTETHAVWNQKRNAPMMSSFLYVKPCLYTTTDNGTFSCLDANTGEFLWQKRLGGALNPSPLYADGKIYVMSEQGVCTVLVPNSDPGEEAEIVAKNELGEHTLSSIAVAGKNLIIRTDKHLWCVGK